LFYKLNVGLG